MDRQTASALNGHSQEAQRETQWLASEALYRGARGAVSIRELQAGEALPSPRSLPQESAIFVLSGTGTSRLDSERCGVNPGQGVYYPEGSERDFVATGDEPTILLDVWGVPSSQGDKTVPPTSRGHRPQRISNTAENDDGFLKSAGGFIDMGVHWLATSNVVGSHSLVLATSTFTPGGSHQLHRHGQADEFFLVVEGGGTLLTERGGERMEPGDFVFIAADEWHGFTTDPGVTTGCVYGYLGAGSLEQAGYEIQKEGTR